MGWFRLRDTAGQLSHAEICKGLQGWGASRAQSCKQSTFWKNYEHLITNFLMNILVFGLQKSRFEVYQVFRR